MPVKSHRPSAAQVACFPEPPLVARTMSPHPDSRRHSLPNRDPKPHETQSPPPGRRRRAGAPPGNLNALKHGFYTGGAVFAPPSRRQETQSPPPGRRLKHAHLDGDPYDLAEILRILCLASSTISRVIRTQFLLNSNGTPFANEIDEAIRQFNNDLLAQRAAAASDPSLLPPSLQPTLPLPSDKKCHPEKD
jgi:hypothetical protein